MLGYRELLLSISLYVEMSSPCGGRVPVSGRGSLLVGINKITNPALGHKKQHGRVILHDFHTDISILERFMDMAVPQNHL